MIQQSIMNTDPHWQNGERHMTQNCRLQVKRLNSKRILGKGCRVVSYKKVEKDRFMKPVWKIINF